MARILFTLPPLTGHLNPALAVAAVLMDQGHSIAFAVHAKIANQLPQAVQVYLLDDGVNRELAAEVPAARGLESVRLFFEDYALPLAERALGPLENIVRAFRPDVMVIDHQMVAGALVARKLDVIWVSLVTTTASILKMSPMLDAWVAELYDALQRCYLPPERIVERPDFSPYEVIVFSIEKLIGNTHEFVDAPYTFVGPTKGSGRREIEFPWEWLREDRYKLLVSVGTVSRDHGMRFFEVIAAAVATLPQIQAVMVAPPELVALVADNTLVRDYVPQIELLKRIDGVICHGGHNTVCEALSAGLPLIVAPIRDDQSVIARQVVDAGAGIFMRYGKVTPAAARKTIEALMTTPELGRNAQILSQALGAVSGAENAAAIIANMTKAIAVPHAV